MEKEISREVLPLKKKWLVVIGVILAVSIFATVAFVDNPIKLFVNGQEIKPDVPPQIINGRTMVPIRWVAEALGADVEWEETNNGGVVRISIEGELQKLLQRLRAIEPIEPKTITESYRDEKIAEYLAEHETIPVQKILDEGKAIPFEVLTTNDTWKRPYYSKNWHSTFMDGKFSSIQNITFLATHDYYILYGGASETSSLLNGLELPIEATETKYPGQGVSILSLNSKVKEIKLLDQQMLVIVEPQLTGFQTIWVKFSDMEIEPESYLLEQNERKSFFIQYITPEGYLLEQNVETW